MLGLREVVDSRIQQRDRLEQSAGAAGLRRGAHGKELVYPDDSTPDSFS